MNNQNRLLLYHTGFGEIRHPDIHLGRRNADFGQGFYLSPDYDFARRWAKERPGIDTYLNEYVLDTSFLHVKRFSRDGEWFDYIFRNRNGYEDDLAAYDVITGPIANDTIYDTWGILTSGMLSRHQALSLLTVGPLYEQTVIKTEKAAAALEWISSQVLDQEQVKACRAQVREEEKAYQEIFRKALGAAMDLLE